MSDTSSPRGTRRFPFVVGVAGLLLAGGLALAASDKSPQASLSTLQPSRASDEVNVVNSLMEQDWLNEGHPVTISNDGLPSFGPNPFTAQSYYEDNHYVVRMQRVPASIPSAPRVRYALRFTTVVPGTPRPLDQGLLVYQAFEGSKVGTLGWGTANARPISVGFWARGSVAGKYAFAIQNLYPDPPKPPRHVPDRSFVANFALAANRWQFVRLENIPGDRHGQWIRAGVTPALQMGFTLQYPTAPATPGVTLAREGTWTRGNALASTGQVNLPDHPGASFEFTGIRWNVGPKLAAGQPTRPAAQELALMRRNFQKSYPEGVMIGSPNQPGYVQWKATRAGTYAARIPVRFKSPLRSSSPRMVTYGEYSGRQRKISIDGLDEDPAMVVSQGQCSALVVTQPRIWKAGDVVQFQWTAEGPWM